MSLSRFALWVTCALCVGLSACDSAEDDVTLEVGTYAEFGERLLLDGDVVSEGLAGVYFGRSLRFSADGTFSVEVFSDYPPEEGVAQGRYETADGGLNLYVETTTSQIYETGEVVRYERVEGVGESYQTTFGSDETGVEFEGPGLILSSELEDPSGRFDERESYFRGPLASP